MGATREPLPEVAASTTSRLVPLHPESIAGDERTLRWVIPAGTLDFVGAPARLPQALQGLLDVGVLDAVCVEPAAVRTALAAGQTWRDQGDLVRGALQEALGEIDRWRPPEAGSSADDLLAAVVQQVIDGEVGAYIRSHGGRVELLRAHGDDVEVILAGACSHCPAAEFTLTSRIETGIRALYPALGQLTARAESSTNLTRRVLGMAQSVYPGRSGP